MPPGRPGGTHNLRRDDLVRARYRRQNRLEDLVEGEKRGCFSSPRAAKGTCVQGGSGEGGTS